jgi:Family of unknown function (DUF6229)
MNDTSNGVELVAQWRDQGNQNNPAGPLFAAGEFAEADIVSATPGLTCGTACSGSFTRQCC